MLEGQSLGCGDLLTVRQAMDLVPIGRSSFYQLLNSGLLPHYRVSVTGSGPGRILIDRADLEAFLAGARQAATRALERVDVDAIRDRVRRRRA